jgi:hypothetical protein
MKDSSIQIEVLLVAGTSFTMPDLYEKEFAKNGDLSVVEQLEQACWNGLLNELVPTFILLPMDERKYFIWQIRQGASLLQIQLSDSVIEMAAQSSIDPNLFLSPVLNN